MVTCEKNRSFLKYTYLIVASDTISNIQLRSVLDTYQQFICLGFAKTAEEGLNEILKNRPTVVFLYLNEASVGQFEMLTVLHQYMACLPYVIGISKTKMFAYQGIKHNFFDYWLQPFNEVDIRKAMVKLQRLKPIDNAAHTLCLKSYNDFHFLDTQDILYLQADNNTTEFHMIDGSVHNAYKTLKTFENKLPINFVRIHQSYIVNSDYISRINFGKKNCALKFLSRPLPFSRTYRDNIEELKHALSKSSLPRLN